MRVAFYGNNLNKGYLYVSSFREHGVEATLFCGHYGYEQERHHWWTDRAPEKDFIRNIRIVGLNTVCTQNRLATVPEVRELYESVRHYDVLVMAEDGPALFSELNGIRKVFISFGADLQNLPFMVRHFWSLDFSQIRGRRALVKGVPGVAIKALREYITYRRVQRRQRTGLRQCDAIVATGGHQSALIEKLGLQSKQVAYLPLPMDPGLLEEVDRNELQQLKQLYEGIDILFFHPTRQLYLRMDNNVFLKDNDKLLHAFNHFVRSRQCKAKLLLVEKGRRNDIEYTKKLIRQMDLNAQVEWLPEMPNKRLRAYYQLEQVVVCDQYSSNIAMLGNIGREATYYGKMVITAFNTHWNGMLYGHDMPPNVFPAATPDEILAAMCQVSAFSRTEAEKRSSLASEWFNRNLHKDAVVPRYVDLLLTIIDGAKSASQTL